MASIVFRPTCSSCKKILESEIINLEEADELYASNELVMSVQYNISPCKCPNCGAMFNHIIAPGAMHFPISDDTLMSHVELIKEGAKNGKPSNSIF